MPCGYDHAVTGPQQPDGQPPYGQPPYGQPAYGQPAYGQPAYGRPPAPKATSTAGPRLTLTLGVLLVAVAVVVGVLAGRAIVGLIPSDVLRADGSPGDGVLAVLDAPGAGDVALVGGRTYSVYLVTQGRDTALDGSPVVTTGDGARVSVGTRGMSSHVQMGSTRAELVAVVDAVTSGTYAIEVPGTVDGFGGQLYVAEGDAMGDVLGGVFGGVFGILAAVGLGVIGLVLSVVGAVMWAVRRGNAKDTGRR